MLSRDAKRVLSVAKESPNKMVSYRTLEEKWGWDFYKSNSVCSQLIQQGYASVKMSHPHIGTPGPCGIILSEEGREHWKYTLADIGKLLLCDILLPIIVAVITTLITLWINGFFTSNNV